MQATIQAARMAQFSGLVHQIYASSAEPNRWPETVGAVAQAMGAMQAVLFTPYVGPGVGGLMFPWQVEEKDLILYGTKYINHDIWAQGAQRKGLIQDGAVALDEELVPQEELLASIYYREFLRPMGVGRLCSGVVFEGAPGLPSTVLSIYRGPDDPFGPPEREFMRLLVPHLSRSLGLMHRLNQARYELESMRAALNRLSLGIFLLDQHMGVIHANSMAQQVISRGDGLRLDEQKRLSATAFQQQTGQRLEAWMTQLVARPEHQRGSFGDTFEVARSEPKSRYSVQCCTLEPGDPLTKGEGAQYIVFVTDPQRLELLTPDQLQKQFGLTPAEARVTLAMVQGGTYKDVAQALGVSEETIRSQIRATYAKTHTSDKANLTRMVLSLAKVSV